MSATWTVARQAIVEFGRPLRRAWQCIKSTGSQSNPREAGYQACGETHWTVEAARGHAKQLNRAGVKP